MCPHLSAAAQQVQGLWESDMLRVGEYAVLCEGFVAAAAAGGDAALQSQASLRFLFAWARCQKWTTFHLANDWQCMHKSCARGASSAECLQPHGTPQLPCRRPASDTLAAHFCLQVLQWTLEPVRAAWTQPAVSARLVSPAAFFGHYIALQPDPAGGVLVHLFVSVSQFNTLNLKDNGF